MKNDKIEINIHKYRNEILSLHNNQCDICKCSLKEILIIHHLVSTNNGGNNEYDNLKVLCPNCFAILRRLRMAMRNNIEGDTQELENWLDNNYSKIANEKIDHWIKEYIQKRYKIDKVYRDEVNI